ncbi:MAG: fumarate reductase subunit D [Rhodoferax sp.]|nr:fumarate reductase subunit D [Rhodoferax sp.]MCF8209716.1 fumarate reductase subunit D [Rhodoferax sp.]
MAKSNKPIFWSLFAAGGTLAAFLAPVLALLFILASLGHAPGLLTYAGLHAFAASWFGKLFLLAVITLFLWHAAHRLRVTLHDFGLRQDSIVAIVVYVTAAIGTGLTLVYLLQI